MIQGLAERLIELRKKKGLSQQALADRLNITKSSVNSWEGKRAQPSLLCLMKMAYIYHVSVDYLLGIDNQQTMDVSGLTDAQMQLLHEIADNFRELNQFKAKPHQ